MKEKGITASGVIKRGAVAALLFVLIAVLPAFAWFNYTRRLAAVSKVATPTAIYINAANQEDIEYLTLNGIDVTGEDAYKDYVFCVRGTDVTSYKIQLAYTTNNQFEYELYHAKLSDSATVPAGAFGEVIFYTHPDQTEQHYYIQSGETAIPGTTLNQQATTEILAKTDDQYYQNPDYGSYKEYTTVNKYAVPLYWQTNSPLNADYYAPMHGSGDFCDYFVLRVKWDTAKANAEAAGLTLQNNKETDIIYISAKNVS